MLVALAQAFAQCAALLHPVSDAETAEPSESGASAPDAAVKEAISGEEKVEATLDSDEGKVAEPDLAELLASIEEVEPEEAKTMRLYRAGKKRLSKEEHQELAVVAVKRAFSECPSYSLLIQALLAAPLHELYLRCRLVPGVPVHPMLAKPTKEIGEVLRRLSGLAFTMEYKYDGERAQVGPIS